MDRQSDLPEPHRDEPVPNTAAAAPTPPPGSARGSGGDSPDPATGASGHGPSPTTGSSGKGPGSATASGAGSPGPATGSSGKRPGPATGSGARSPDAATSASGNGPDPATGASGNGPGPATGVSGNGPGPATGSIDNGPDRAPAIEPAHPGAPGGADAPAGLGADPAGASGVLFLVVGPSGVGKDSLIDGVRATLSEARFAFARRVVTRPREAGGEDHEPMDAAGFAAAQAAGAFAVTWGAHALHYGIRHEALAPLAEGRNVIVNASRQSIGDFTGLAPRIVVLSITAPPEVVRARLEARGREDAADVAARLSRKVPLEGARNIAVIDNGGDMEAGIAAFRAALLGAAHLPLRARRLDLSLPGGQPVALLNRAALPLEARQLVVEAPAEIAGPRPAAVRLALTDDNALAGPDDVALPAALLERMGVADGAPLALRRAPPPASRSRLRRKVAGEELSAADIEAVVGDIVAGRYSEAEVAGFLVSAARHLSLAEVAALTSVRAALMPRLEWGGRRIVDKHSMGGVPGNPISLVVVPIVAAHGLPIPKTSSRAITSAAGTADIMECAARVDLTPDELRRVVEGAGGSIAWSGRISHSALDDVMNAINRPLGLSSVRLDVSSILSKKLAAGASHVAIDIPVGPAAKVRSAKDGRALADLFEEVGRAVGLTVRAMVSDGRAPVGHGVGPALELADAMAVLEGAPEAPAALRQKALTVAASILEWDEGLVPGSGRAVAERLLQSGAARAAFEAIAAAQGAVRPVRPGVFTHPLRAARAGRVAGIDVFAVAGLARAVGAPGDKGAGVRMRAAVGDDVAAGEVLAEAVASNQSGIEAIRPGAAEEMFTLA